jgi:hypothetical protein
VDAGAVIKHLRIMRLSLLGIRICVMLLLSAPAQLFIAVKSNNTTYDVVLMNLIKYILYIKRIWMRLILIK